MADNYFNYYERRRDSRIAPFIISANKHDNMLSFKNHLSTLSSYFNDLQSMANAYKHLYTNSGNAYVTVESGGAISVGESDIENYGVADDLKDNYCSQVYYRTKDGNTHTVKEALDDLMGVWKTLLNG